MVFQLPLLYNHANSNFMSLSVLLCLEERKAAGLGSALSALQKQLSRLPVPYTQRQVEADEHGLCRCCNALAAFTKPFIEAAMRKNGNYITNSEEEELRMELFKLYVSVCVWLGLCWDFIELLFQILKSLIFI